ncbi:MAG: hypothetical protein HFH64_04025 [Lachnospiraceae bacterium]|nr:hypothetical protein [Lachnospiraceae bacterium]
MKKKKLELLDIAPRYQRQHKSWEFLPHMEKVAGEDILVIDIYYSMNNSVTYRIFLGKEDYITLDMNCGKEIWTHKDLGELIHVRWIYETEGQWYRKIHDKVLIEPEGLELIYTYTGYTKAEPEYCIICYQEKKNKEKRLAKEHRETDRWDKEIGTLPKLPPDWEEFISREAIKENYIFYHRETKDIGKCSYCGKTVYIHARHNLRTRCPECGKYVTLKDLSRKSGRERWRDYRKVWLIQKDDERLIFRRYKVYKDYNQAVFNIHTKSGYRQELMCIMSLDRNSESWWQWGCYKNHLPERWVKNHFSDFSGDAFESCCLYNRNTKEWQEYMLHPYLPVKEIPYETEISIAFFKWCGKDRLEAAEKLMKVGLWHLGSDVITGYLPAKKKINQILEIENDDLEILKAVNADYDQYNFFQKMKSFGKRPSAEEMALYICTNIPLSLISKLIPYTSFHQIYKRYKYNSAGILGKYYNDYFNMCKELGFDMKSSFVLFPKNIKKAHDDLVLYYNEKKDEIEEKKRNRIYAKVEKIAEELNRLYGVEDEEYFIRAPKNAAEIIKEGHAMHHCVAGKQYTEKMVKGESYILFIRKKSNPEKSWYTMEMKSDHTVVQVRGFANRDDDNIRQKNIWKLLTERLKELKKNMRAAG